MQAFSPLAVSQNASFIFFLSPERKPKQKKECKNVLAQRPEPNFFKTLNALGFAASLAKNSLRSNNPAL